MSRAPSEMAIRITTTVLLLVAVPSFGAAQIRSTPYDEAIRASAALRLAGRVPATSVTAPQVANDALVVRRGTRSQGATLMIIGGAAIVVGALAGGSGGTLLIVGGAVCAGYGFFLYSE